MVTFPKNDDEGLSLLSQPTTTTGSDYLSTLFELPTNKEVLTSGKLSPLTIPNETNHKIRSSLIPFFSHPTNLIPSKTTGIGSVVFLLYHIVFCLAQAATITRPHSTNPSVGIMSQMAALGIVTAGPLFLYFLGEDIPAIYPASDLFLAPFLAQLAREIDTVLFEKDLHNNDTVFMATFGAVVGVGFLLSGFLCVLAARFQLANLGAFLPYSVLCGFFTTIGILMYSLGFSVDVGTPIGEVLWSGDWQVIRHALGHHFPSLLIGILMHFMGPKNPLFVIWILLGTVFGSYIVLWMTGTTLTQAQELQWFFAAKDLYVDHQHRTIGSYGPPAPFGTWFAVWNGEVVWEAFFAGIPTMLSLVFLYVVRCSLHSAALKKNIPNVTRKKPHINESASSIITGQETKTNKKKTRSLTLGSILESGYGYSQLLSGFMGGIAIAPSVAASLTLFELGAEAPPPQYGSCLLVLIFLVWDFSLVQYIPKPAFSCLMVLAGMDMCRTWVVVSYQKTKAKLEWTVGPILVVLAFSIGVLNAIFCGIACSTFIFAANFYRVGAVKFVGNGLTLRSTVERGIAEEQWLNQNGDWIQILVIQHYLFFGNSQSLLNYITTMFEDVPPSTPEEERTEDACNVSPLPPKPKYIVLDFAMVSGMDTSAVDIIREIIDLCQTDHCKLFVAGLKPSIKASLMYAGIKPSFVARKRSWVYANDMEAALAKAEDELLSSVFHLEEKVEIESNLRHEHWLQEEVNDGFSYALQKLDERHGLNTCQDLKGFQPFTYSIDLKPGGVLVRDPTTNNHGLHFVETGLMKVQWSQANTIARLPYSTMDVVQDSIGHLDARSRTMGREAAMLKESMREHPNVTEQGFRLARIGQGWIIGGIELANGMNRPGVHIAISTCRLHHLPYSAIQMAERENPLLAMSLYKILSHLAIKRQEMTIEHLGQHLHILHSPVPRLRGGKKATAELQNPLGNYSHLD